MALRYEWSFDLAALGAIAVKVTDDGGTFESRIASGTYAHTNISTVEDGYTDFAATLEGQLDADSSAPGYTVTWNGTTGYTIAYSGATLTLSFTTVATPAEGTRMRQLLGMSGNRTGATSYSSQVRPYYVIIPAIQGRTPTTAVREVAGIMSEAVSDDGTARQVSRDTAELHEDWTQAAETATAPATFSDEGTPVYTWHASAAVPWTYQHAWQHQRLAHHPFLVIDGSDQTVHQVRAEGASLEPTFFAGGDFSFWTVPFRTRVLGRL